MRINIGINMDKQSNQDFINYISELNDDLLFDNMFNVEFLFSPSNDELKTALQDVLGASNITIEEYLKTRIGSFQVPTNSSEVLTDFLNGRWLHTAVRRTDDKLQITFFESEDTNLKMMFHKWIKMTTPESDLFPDEYSVYVNMYPINSEMDSYTMYDFKNMFPYEVNDMVLDLTKELSIKMVTVSFNYRENGSV